MADKKAPRKGRTLLGVTLPSGTTPVVFNKHPVESPTMGATGMMGMASLDSPTAGATGGFGAAAVSGQPVPPNMMPPPPVPSAGQPARASSSLATKNYVALPDLSVEGQPALPRISLSPSKRSRDSKEEATPAGGSGGSSTSSATASSSSAAATSVAGGGPAGCAAVVIDDEKEEENEEEEDEPESPTKRQVRKSVADRPPDLSPPAMTIVDMFSPGMLRVNVFRIPALLTLPEGVTLTFAEARPNWHDAGVIDIVMRRSTDAGHSWSPAKVIIRGDDVGKARTATVGNPCAVYDAQTRTVWMLFCTNHADDCEWMIHANEGVDTRRVWVTSSADFGLAWAAPKEITSSVKLGNWTWYATGPGRAIQLQSGRLLFPANHAENVHEPHCPYLPDRQRSRMVAHSIYSDDHGRTWKIGGIAARHTNETTVAQLGTGQLVMNSRDWSGRFLRVIQTSHDDGNTWQQKRHDATLIEPEPQGCQGSMIAMPPRTDLPSEPTKGRGVLFFCNPSSDRRELLTIRRSDDGGATWSRAYCLEKGASAYSSMGRTSDGALGVLYERGDRISFAKIPSHPDGPLGVF